MANEGVIRLKCESYEREAGLDDGDIHCGLFQPCTEQVEGYWCSQGARPVLRPKRRYRPGLFCLSEVRVLFHCPRSHCSNYSHLRVRWLRDSLFYRGCVAFRHVQRWLHITTLRYQLYESYQWVSNVGWGYPPFNSTQVQCNTLYEFLSSLTLAHCVNDHCTTPPPGIPSYKPQDWIPVLCITGELPPVSYMESIWVLLSHSRSLSQ